METTDRADAPDRHGVAVTKILAVLLGIATAILVFRLPGAVVLCGAVPAIGILIAGIHKPRPDSVSWWAFLVLATVSSSIAVLFAPGPLPLVNFASLSLVFLVFTAAILATGAEISASHAVMRTIYACFGLTMCIGLGEVITGFKLQSILYPEAPNLLYPGRFYVAAYFPNYNDFGVVVAMFSIMTMGRFLFDAKSVPVQVFRLAAAASGAVLILGGGSRGALGGLLIGWAVLLFLNLRMNHPRLISGTMALIGGFLLAAVALLVWSTPTIQDNSTQVRGQIIENTIALSLENPSTIALGWGHIDAFHAATKAAYSSMLMDPHNLLLEIYTWFGLPALVAFIIAWVVIVYRGVWLMELRPGWAPLTAVVLFALTPVLGIVPSSSLRYYYVFLLAACAVAALAPTTGKQRR